MPTPEFYIHAARIWPILEQTNKRLQPYLGDGQLSVRVRLTLEKELGFNLLRQAEIHDGLDNVMQAWNCYTGAYFFLANNKDRTILGRISLNLGYLAKKRKDMLLAKYYFRLANKYLLQGKDIRSTLPLKMLATISLNAPALTDL